MAKKDLSRDPGGVKDKSQGWQNRHTLSEVMVTREKAHQCVPHRTVPSLWIKRTADAVEDFRKGRSKN